MEEEDEEEDWGGAVTMAVAVVEMVCVEPPVPIRAAQSVALSCVLVATVTLDGRAKATLNRAVGMHLAPMCVGGHDQVMDGEVPHHHSFLQFSMIESSLLQVAERP